MLTGSCRGCTSCCTNIGLMLPTQPLTLEWAKARGLTLVQQNDNLTEFWIPSVCPHLKGGRCDIHGTDKPEACRDYPESMIEFWKRLGFDPNISMGSACGYRVVDENPS